MSSTSNIRRLIIAITACVVVAAVQHAVFAETMSSTNYTIQGDSLNLGGGASSSTNYSGNGAIGDLATGEDLTSTNYTSCAGFECLQSTPFLTFSVTEGTASPGTAGAGIAFGTLTPGTVYSSDGSGISSIFLNVEGVVPGGVDVTVTSANGALARVSSPTTKITSATADLTSATDGYGLCVQTVSQNANSPTTLDKAAPYNSTCDKTTNNNVGVLSTTPQSILTTTGSVETGAAEVLAKVKASSTTGAGSDYQDTLTFIATGSY